MHATQALVTGLSETRHALSRAQNMQLWKRICKTTFAALPAVHSASSKPMLLSRVHACTIGPFGRSASYMSCSWPLTLNRVRPGRAHCGDSLTFMQAVLCPGHPLKAGSAEQAECRETMSSLSSRLTLLCSRPQGWICRRQSPARG